MENIKYCFLHIQKTSGTSIFNYLKMVLDESKFYHHHDALRPGFFGTEFFKDDFDDSHIEFFHGHLDFSQIKIISDTAKIITMLRDPIDRTVSQFYWHQYFFPKINFNWIVNEITDIPTKILERHAPFQDYDNSLTRMISGISNRGPVGCVNEKILDIAKRNLSKMWFIGYQDEFKKTVSMLFRKMGFSDKVHLIDQTDELKLMSATDSSKVLSDQELDTLHALNRFDIKLFNFAKENFPLTN